MDFLAWLANLNASFSGSALSKYIDFYSLGWFMFILTLSIYAISKDQWIRLRKELHQYAMYDLLTGLPNRRMFEERVQEAIAVSERQNRQFALILGDLNRFKSVNDTLGHHAGDALLKEVSRRISPIMRAGDTLSRLGGDEFAFIIQEDSDPAGVARLCERVKAALQAPASLGNRPVELDISLGIALYPQDGTSLEDLLRRADISMYRAKGSGAQYVFYSPEMEMAPA